MSDIIDIMGNDPAPPRVVNPLSLIRTLPPRFAALGIEGAANRATELLTRSENLAEQTWTKQRDAREAMARVTADLGAGVVGLDQVADVTREVGPWLDTDVTIGRVAPAQDAVMATVHQLQSQAVMALYAEALPLYQRLQKVANDAVALITSGPPIPHHVMIAPDAQAAATKAGGDIAYWWVDAEQAAHRFSDAHDLARVLVHEVGGLDVETMWPDGCPSWAGPIYLGWLRAAEADALDLPKRYRSLVVRLRYAHDQGWLPGLWLAEDHNRPEPPGLVSRLLGRK
jgi:hypothetical protein